MSTVVIDGLDSRTTNEQIDKFCQNYGRLLNCYRKSNQCIVTFADKNHAEEFIGDSPHRIDSNSFVNATWKTTLNRNDFNNQRSTNNFNDNCRLIVRGTFEQLEEKSLIRYFSHYGHVRMCLFNSSKNFSTITFDDRSSCERALKESRHFLNGRSLIVEPYKSSTNECDSNKRQKFSNSNEPINFQNQIQQHLQFYEYEKQQWNEFLIKKQNEFNQQITHYQCLLKQSLDEIINKDKLIQQLKQENKDIDDLLRQTIHDNEQQQIHFKKREDIHNQTKRKYEELYKAYTNLKDISSTKPKMNKLTSDDVRKK